MSSSTASPDLVAKLLLNPMKNAKDRFIFGNKTLSGVMDVYTRLGDEEGAELMASLIYELADCIQRLASVIQKIEAEAK